MRGLVALIALAALGAPQAEAAQREWPVAVTGSEHVWLQPQITGTAAKSWSIKTRVNGKDRQLTRVRGGYWPRLHAGGDYAAADLGEDIVRVRISDGAVDVPQPDKRAWREGETPSEPDPSNCDTRPELGGIDASGTVALTRVQPMLPPCSDGSISAQFEAIGVSPGGERSAIYEEKSTMPWDYVFADFVPFRWSDAGWIAFDEYRVDRIQNAAAIPLARRSGSRWTILRVDAAADGRVVTVEERGHPEEGTPIATKVILHAFGKASTVVAPLDRRKGATAKFCGEKLVVAIEEFSRRGDRVRELRAFDETGKEIQSPVKKSLLKTAAAFDCSAELLAISRIGKRPLTKRLTP